MLIVQSAVSAVTASRHQAIDIEDLSKNIQSSIPIKINPKIKIPIQISKDVYPKPKEIRFKKYCQNCAVQGSSGLG